MELAGLGLMLPLMHGLGLGGGVTPLPHLPGLPTSLGVLIALMLGLKVTQILIRHHGDRIAAEIDLAFGAALRVRLTEAMLGANWLALTRERSSDHIQMQLEEIPRVTQGARQFVGLVTTGSTTAMQVALAFWIAPAFTAGVLALGLALAFALRGWQRRRHVLDALAPKRRANLAGAVTEHLAGLKLAKSFGRTSALLEHFRRMLDSINELLAEAHRRHANLRLWSDLVVVVVLAGLASSALLSRSLAIGPLLLLGFLFSRLLGQASQMHSSWQTFAVALPSHATVEQQRLRYLAAAETPSGDASSSRLTLTRELRCENLTFRYQTDRAPALDRVDITIAARQVTALCGRSGAGKSTLADLALGLFAADSGRILVDGQPLDGERLHAWRRSIGYVPQDTFLFHDTIRANLLWAQPNATEADLRAALHASAADGFVSRLPERLDTVVGDRGQRLSGGERQRLALARALLRRPTLLVLDEATSSLDAHNESLVQDAIDRLRGETTILLIAHRLSTVRAADRIFVLEAGRVAESGTWDELAARGDGAFRALLAADARA